MLSNRFYHLTVTFLVVACPIASGCLFPYAFPKLSYVPGTAPRQSTPDVHAFRVDATADQIDIGESVSFALTRIKPKSDGRFPPQAGLSLERGFYVLGIALNYNVGRLHTTRVRLYRPGFQLVELRAWDSADEVAWIIAADWREQEQSVDALLRRPYVTRSGEAFGKATDASRSDETPRELGQLPELTDYSEDSTDVFVLAATEYERIAKLAPTPDDAGRILEKAKRLRAVIEPLPVPANREVKTSSGQ
jgi:hypothetical protein